MSWKDILDRWGMSWVYKEIWLRMDWSKPTPSSVKKYQQRCISQCRTLMEKGILPTMKGHRDKIMLDILIYSHGRLKYYSDKKIFNNVELWQEVDYLLSHWYIDFDGKPVLVHEGYEKPEEYPEAFLAGDCEDGAGFIFAYARAHGISQGQVREACGNVMVGDEEEGHCYVEYLADESFGWTPWGEWFTIDWCYYYDKTPFEDRIAKSDKYSDVWFTQTDMEVE